MSSFKKYLKKIKYLLDFLWKTTSVYYSFYKRHNSIYNNGEFLVDSLTKDEKIEYLSYWKRLSPFVSTKTVEISKSLSGKYNKLIVPEEIFALEIEGKLNPRSEVSFLQNKNIYNKWFDGDFFPLDYFHCMESVHYDGNHNVIDDIDLFIKNTSIEYPLVFKPSVDSYGGQGVEFVFDEIKLKYLMQNYSNYVVQEKLIQSEDLNIINSSVNTVRVCLYRPASCQSYKVINCSLRMGVDGSLDNATAGGIVCNISDSGYMNEYAVNKKGLKLYAHPNTGFVFKNIEFPNYEELLKATICIANQVPNTSLISMDMCLDSNDNWRCIEFTMFGQTIRFAQYAGSPFFGIYTDDVMSRLVG